MADLRAVPIAGEWVTGREDRVVASPYDGSELGPGAGPAGAPTSTGPWPRPRPPWPQPLRALAAGRGARHARPGCCGSAARTSPAPSPPRRPSPSRRPGSRPPGRWPPSPSPPPRPGPWRATWSRSTPPTTARASWPSRCGCPSASSAPSPRSTSRSTWWPTSWRPPSPPAARWCSSRPGQTPLSAIALAELLLDECGLPAGWLHVVTGVGLDRGQRPRRAPRRRPHHLHRLARGGLGHPGRGAPQEGRPRAGQQRPAHHPRRRRLGDGGREGQGRRVQPRRPVLHLDPADLRAPRRGRRLRRRPRRPRVVAGGRRPAWTRTPTCRPSSRGEDTERVKSWIDDAVAEGAKRGLRRRCGGRRARRRRCSPA